MKSTIYSYATVVVQNNTNDFAIVDSGPTGHFLQMDSICRDKKRTSDGVCVKLPDGSTIEATHTALINYPQLPLEARRAHLFLDIKYALLSISFICDHGFTVIFDEDGVYIVKEGGIIMHIFRHPVTKLYIVNMKKTILQN